MAEHTAMLREWFDQYQDGTKTSRQLIEAGRTTLFDFDYPIFDDDYKNVFETHFIRKFYMREIGFETFGLFKFQLETWLLINMPYFNKLFESELLEYDPLTNSKMDTTYTKRNDSTQSDEKTSQGDRSTSADTKKTGTTTGLSNVTNDQNTDSQSISNKSETTNQTDNDFNRELDSNNPDTRLTITTEDGAGVIEYASSIKEQTKNATKNETSSGQSDNSVSTNDHSTSTQTANSSSDETDKTSVQENDNRKDTATSTIQNLEDYIQHRTGKIGVQTYAKMIVEYRTALLRVEQTIFNEMNELFMLVY